MIVEIPDHDKIAEHARKIVNAREEIQHYEAMDKHSYRGFDRVYERRIRLDRLKSVVIPPKDKLFVPEKLSPREVNALRGTKWTSDGKPTDNQQTVVIGAVVALIGSAIASLAFSTMFPWPEATKTCAIIATMGFIALLMEFGTARSLFHYYRVTRVDVDAITSYSINGRLTSGLRLRLGTENWQRLIDGLKAGDPELESAFENYCKGSAWHVNKRDRADDNYDVDPSELNDTLLTTAVAEANTFDHDAATAINGLFAARDAEELRVKQALEEAALQLESDEAQRKLLESAHDSGMLEVELKYQKPVFKL